MEPLVLKGERYEGTFKAQLVDTKVRRGSCEWSYYEEATYWHGASVIKDLKENAVYPFILRTKALTSSHFYNLPKYVSTLEGNIVFFRNYTGPVGSDLVERPENVSHERAIDMSLEKIVEQIKQAEKERGPLPEIMPYPIEYEELAKLGFLKKKAVVKEGTEQLSFEYVTA